MSLIVDISEYLFSRPEIASIPSIGKSTEWGIWVFPDVPQAKIENSQKLLIVVSRAGSWESANAHNTMRFPKVNVDVWADCTRSPDRTVLVEDADDKIEAAFKAIDKCLHLPNNADDSGGVRYWGPGSTPILSSKALDTEPDFSDVRDSKGTRMGRKSYGFTTC